MRGGKRENSGRKQKPATVTINFRVPDEKSQAAKNYLRLLLKEFLKNN